MVDIFTREKWAKDELKFRYLLQRCLHESDSWPEALLYNLGNGSWLPWANDTAAHYQGCARDLISRNRDETETRRCSFRDAGWDLEALESFNVSPRRLPWRMVKHIVNERKLYRFIKSHRGKHFLFLILWVFAFYFDNYQYHWIINGLHHKELQLQCCGHEPLCLWQFASNWN